MGRRSAFPTAWWRSAAYLAYDPSQRFPVRPLLSVDQPPASRCPDLHDAWIQSGRTIFWSATAMPRICGLVCRSAMPEVNIMQATASACRPAISAGLDARNPRLSKAHAVRFQRLSCEQQGRQGSALPHHGRTRIIPALSATLDLLKRKGIDVIVLGPIVEYDSALPRLLAEEILHNKPSTASAMRTPGIHERDRAMSRIVTAKGATYISVYDQVCRNGRCDEFAEGDIPHAVRRRSSHRGGIDRSRAKTVDLDRWETGGDRTMLRTDRHSCAAARHRGVLNRLVSSDRGRGA